MARVGREAAACGRLRARRACEGVGDRARASTAAKAQTGSRRIILLVPDPLWLASFRFVDGPAAWLHDSTADAHAGGASWCGRGLGRAGACPPSKRATTSEHPVVVIT